jgi:class 3 adenylate cyclase/tetratricopeptide (TPR) repeat protein
MREERRTVTALFADVAGSTALGERLDPEDVREVVGEAVKQMAEVVERFGGTVKDVAGDGVLALFGAPIAHEDDAERAVLAGLELQRRIAEHAETVRREHDVAGFGVRVGIETGLVVMGPVGGGTRVEYGATGDVVNTAARLQAQAPVGSVLVGPSTRGHVDALFAWSDPMPLELRGKVEPVHASVALHPLADASRARRLPGRGAPLVGRDAELAAGTAAIERLANGLGGTLVIAGEAGIGKTRLLESLRESAPPSFRWLEAACTSFGSSSPYAPVAQVLTSWLRMGDGSRRPEDLVPVERRDARAAIAVLGRDVASDERAIFDELSPEGRQLATVEGLDAFLRSVAAGSPTVVVVEDLHWCDPSSLHALERLLALASTDPIAFVLTTRVDHGSLAAEMLDRASRSDDRVQRIYLDALPAGSDRRLVGALVGEGALPPALLESVLEVGAGNPFFLGELVRSLIDTGTLVPSDGGWRVGAEARPELPSTVDRVLLARIDRLPNEDRDVLTAASVLGRRFSPEVLATLLGTDPAAALARLTDLDLVRPEPPDHAFAHALVQETAYATLLRKRRRELHARAAVAIETQGDAEGAAALLGRHHAGAGNAEEALRWFIRAADRAEAVSALLEAIEDLDAALGVAGPDDEAIPELRVRRGRLRGRTGDHRGARADLEEALRLATARSDRALEMRCRDEIGFLVAGSADYRESVEHLERALAIADELGDAAGRVSALSRLTITWANRLQLDRAERSGELALEVALATGDERLVASALDARKPVALMLGRLDEVERYGEQLRPLYARRNDRWLEQFVDLETAFASLARWRFGEARERLERSLATNRELHDDGNEPLHLATFSHLHRCRGDVDAAVETGRRALALARERDHLEWTAFAASQLGAILLQVGARGDAIDVLRAGVDAAERSGADLHGLRCIGSLARALARENDQLAGSILRSADAKLRLVGLPPGEVLLFAWDASVGVAAASIDPDPKRALETIDPIVEQCAARGWPEAVVDASLVRAAALTVLEDRDGALSAAHLADAWCERYGVRIYAWRTAAALAATLPDRDGAERAVERARASADALLASIDDASLRNHLSGEVDRVLMRGGTAWA